MPNKVLNLVDQINLEQKQDVSAGLLNLTFGYLTKTIWHKFYNCNEDKCWQVIAICCSNIIFKLLFLLLFHIFVMTLQWAFDTAF